MADPGLKLFGEIAEVASDLFLICSAYLLLVPVYRVANAKSILTARWKQLANSSGRPRRAIVQAIEDELRASDFDISDASKIRWGLVALIVGFAFKAAYHIIGKDWL